MQKKQIYKRNIIYTAILAVIFVLYLITVIRNPGYGLGMIMLALSAAVIVVIWMMAWRYRSSQAKAVSQVKEDFNMTVYENGIPRPSGKTVISPPSLPTRIFRCVNWMISSCSISTVSVFISFQSAAWMNSRSRRSGGFFENNLVTDETKK